MGDTTSAQHLQVARHGIELRLRAKHLQRAAGALLVLDAGVSTQLLQASAAVFRHPHHAFLVDCVTRWCAVGQHAGQPAQLEQRAVGAQGQRRMFLK